MRYILLLLTSLLLQGCDAPAGESRSEKDFSMLSPCERPEQVRLTAIVTGSLCGTISVSEDREVDGGRKIALNVMVIPAISPTPKSDPIVFLAGGPGQAATEAGPFLFSLLSELREERDVVLVDQRGTGKSSPLDCGSEEDFSQLDLTTELWSRQQADLIMTCLENYDADPSLYTTPVAIDDLNEVIETLGFEQVNLLGMSYGTRAGLVFIRRHGDKVRSAFLDGVAPTTMVISRNIAVDAQSAFDRMLTDCMHDTACAAAFPNLEQHFYDMISHLQDHPDPVSLTNPRTGKVTLDPVSPIILAHLIRSVLYDRTLSALLPLSIEEAYQGRYQPLVTLGYSFLGDDPGMSVGMMSSVLCSEDMTRTSAANDEGLIFQNALYHMLENVCTFWPQGDIPPAYFEPVQSDIPILLSSGVLDPVTPPVYAEEAMKSLTNALHLRVPGVGHGTILHGCVADILMTFLAELKPAQLDTSCLADLSRPPFFTSLAGPVSSIPGDSLTEAEDIRGESVDD